MFAASMQRARALQARRTALSRSLVRDGTYDLSAIMSAAMADAKVHRLRDPSRPWRLLVASALRFVWSRAKAQRAQSAPLARSVCN
jgi:hypothetical protein